MQSKLVNDFIRYLRSKDKSELTIKKYSKEAEAFLVYIKNEYGIEENEISKVDRKIINKYLIYLSEKGDGASTRANKVSSLKALCIFRPHPDTDSGNIRTAFRNYPDSITAHPDTLSND